MATKSEEKKKNITTKGSSSKKNTSKKKIEQKEVNKKTKIVKEEKEKLDLVDETIDFDDEFDDEEEDLKINITKKSNNKKDKKSSKKKNDVLGDSLSQQNGDLIRFIKILVFVFLFVIIFYLIFASVRGDFKDSSKYDEDENSTIQNNEIIAGSVFTKSDKEYYVLFYNSTSDSGDLYATMYSDYISSEYDYPMFWVDLNSSFNSGIISSDGSNEDAQTSKDLKVVEPTLIHIKNGKNVDYYEGSDVKDILIKLINE